MKTLTMLVMPLLIGAVINTTQATDATVSPNGFKSPECTFACDMNVGTDVLTYGGATFRAAWFYDLGNNTVYCWDNGKTYPLKAFITKR